MPTTTVVPAVVGYLVDQFTAAATLGAATPPVRVFCGPELSKEFSPLAVWVGLDDQTVDQVGAISNQQPVGMAQVREEQFAVNCFAEAWSGDTGTRSAMTTAYGIVAAVGNLVHADRTLGGLILDQFPGSTAHVMRWHQGEGGAACRVYFHIEGKALIGD